MKTPKRRIKERKSRSDEVKMFVIRKYVLADSAQSALRLDSVTKVHEVFVDEEWRQRQGMIQTNAVGFQM